jgi:16S rRNA (adenine1518-N6/adenine1519-N6)-dimethyltransferase
VRSTVLKIELFAEPLAGERELVNLRGLVRAAFGQRRKTLSNTMTAWLNRERSEIDGFLRAQGVDPKRRGETLGVDDFVKLSHAIGERRLLTSEI